MRGGSVLVSVQGVWKRFEGQAAWVLRGVSLEAGPGDMLLVMGRNGSGKTTLLRIIAGLTEPSRGRVAVGGRPPSSREARRILGVVLHSPLVYEELTVRENLEYYAGLYGVEDYDPRLDGVAESLGVARVLGARVSSLSFGWRRRVDIVRALIHRPRVLLLDEPTTGLDEDTVEALLDLTLDLSKRGVTVLATSPRRLDAAIERGYTGLELVEGRLGVVRG
jgi:heme exporter protein A